MDEKYEPKFLIDEELLQCEAESCVERQLTDDEIEQVIESIYENISEFLWERITGVVDFNELLERNKGAESEQIHFDVYYRNENAYQPQFKSRGSFRTEKDAKEYAHHDFITEDDQWKIVRVEGSAIVVVWSVNVK